MKGSPLRASVIIRTRDEAPRLRLTLASLAAQSAPLEVVVVNDGSRDDTAAVIAAAPCANLVAVHHANSMGRAASSNDGASRAAGDILIFLDGDTLAGPDFVARHLDAHANGAGVVARGETYHLRQTRLFADPQTGSPMPGEEARVAALSSAERDRTVVTLEKIAGDFGAIAGMAAPGIYPGAGPRRLYELEMAALRDEPNCDVLWAAASGANQSVPKSVFTQVGGFHAAITINAHREVALRLCRAGLKMTPAEGAFSYHMTHRKGWRDPLEETGWEALFYAAHPIPEVPLLSVLWATLADDDRIAPHARIFSIPELSRAARRCQGVVGADAVRAAHFAASLGVTQHQMVQG
ncbi:MAG TPA: glycosyltransferase [Caulobacteraceae bacterium]|jgi:GT2 family glycosyltransferase|nr:glycosyltransferase [Caulobacteraceae bacterium]